MCETLCYDYHPNRKRTLSGSKLFSLGSTTNTTIESSEGNDLLVLFYVSQVLIGLGQFQACGNNSNGESLVPTHTDIELASESSTNFPHVLEVSTEVFPSRT